MRNHYVPQFLLKNFAATDRGATWVFDKWSGRSFLAGSRKVAAEHGFYDYPNRDSGLKTEAELAQIEAAAATTIEDILSRRELQRLDDESRREVGRFVMTLLFRTPTTRGQVEKMDELLKERLEQLGGDPLNIRGYSPLRPGGSGEVGTSLTREAPRYFELITAKAWFLMESPIGSSFFCSDNPVVMTNTVNQNPLWGTIGLAVPGIEIYLPLTPHYTLAMYCPTLRDWVIDQQQALLVQKWILGTRRSIDDYLNDLANAFRLEGCLVVAPETATFLNSLQVSCSSRFLFSKSGDFNLAEEMIATDERYMGPALPILAGAGQR